MKKLMLFVAAFMLMFGSATTVLAQDPVKKTQPETEQKEEKTEEAKEEKTEEAEATEEKATENAATEEKAAEAPTQSAE